MGVVAVADNHRDATGIGDLLRQRIPATAHAPRHGGQYRQQDPRPHTTAQRRQGPHAIHPLSPDRRVGARKFIACARYQVYPLSKPARSLVPGPRRQRGKHSWGERPGNSEADVVGPAPGREPEADRRPEEAGSVALGAAAKDTPAVVAPQRPRAPIRRRAGIAAMPAVLKPTPTRCRAYRAAQTRSQETTQRERSSSDTPPCDPSHRCSSSSRHSSPGRSRSSRRSGTDPSSQPAPHTPTQPPTRGDSVPPSSATASPNRTSRPSNSR